MIVNYTKANISTVNLESGESFTFIPGINNVDDELWSKMLQNKYFKRDLEDGYYEIEDEDDDIPAPAPGGGGQPQAALARVSDDRTTNVISQTYDIKTLKEMKRNETRPQVIQKIDEQITKLQEERRNNRGRVNADEE